MDPLSRRTFVQSTAAAAATAALGASAATWAAPAAARGPFVPYGARSYFKKPVTGAPVDAARTQAFRSFMRSHPEQRDVAYPLINGLDGNEWGTPFAIGEQHHPVWRLTGDHDKKARRLATRGFHAPDWLGRMLTGTDDSPLCVLDRASGFTMFCANARVVGPHLIEATAGAITYHRSNGLDHRNPRSNEARNFTSRGRISDAMVIRRDLVKHGVRHDTDLGHVLHLFLVETNTSDGFRSPMVGAEGDKFGWGAEGERIAIAPSVDLTRAPALPRGAGHRQDAAELRLLHRGQLWLRLRAEGTAGERLQARVERSPEPGLPAGHHLGRLRRPEVNRVNAAPRSRRRR